MKDFSNAFLRNYTFDIPETMKYCSYRHVSSIYEGITTNSILLKQDA